MKIKEFTFSVEVGVIEHHEDMRGIVAMAEAHNLSLEGSTPSPATHGYNSLENRMCVEYPDPES